MVEEGVAGEAEGVADSADADEAALLPLRDAVTIYLL